MYSGTNYSGTNYSGTKHVCMGIFGIKLRVVPLIPQSFKHGFGGGRNLRCPPPHPQRHLITHPHMRHLHTHPTLHPHIITPHPVLETTSRFLTIVLEVSINILPITLVHLKAFYTNFSNSDLKYSCDAAVKKGLTGHYSIRVIV